MSPVPGDHCDRHEQEISKLRDKAHNQANELAKKESEIVALQRDHIALTGRIPSDIGQWMGKIDEQLRNMGIDLEQLTVAMQQHFVTQTEFRALRERAISFATKEELAPIKGLVYKGIGLVLAAFLGAVLTLVLRQG